MNSRVIGYVEKNRSHLATVTPPIAEQLLFVSTYDSEDPESNAVNKHGYQRPPTESRFKEIAKYFTTNTNRFLITPILVSVRVAGEEEIDKFLKFLDAGDIRGIRTTFGEKIASVVDGQHRYKGLVEAWRQDSTFLPQIPVVLLFGLSFVEEAELFNTVNVTQRKLPKALIETTRGDITEADSVEYQQLIRRLTFSLCRDADSVWGPIKGAEQVNMTGVRDPNKVVTYEGLRRSTSNMFPPTLLQRLNAIDESLPIKYAKKYWRAVSEACAEAWNGIPATRDATDPVTGQVISVAVHYRIKDLVGVAALAKLGKDIISSHIDSHEAAKLDELVSRLVEVDWDKRPDNPWMRSQAGFAGQKELYEVLHALVYSGKKPGVLASVVVSDVPNGDGADS